MNEPEIVINGVHLTEAQAMTVRVAIGAYAMDLKPDDSLGAVAAATLEKVK